MTRRIDDVPGQGVLVDGEPTDQELVIISDLEPRSSLEHDPMSNDPFVGVYLGNRRQYDVDVFIGGASMGVVASQDVLVDDLYDQLEEMQLLRGVDALSRSVERLREACTTQPGSSDAIKSAISALDQAWATYHGSRDRYLLNR